jgi:hypothetical protein
MALIFTQSAPDKCVILGTRESLIYPFTAPLWTDIRLGMFLSITNASASDDRTGVAETLPDSTLADLLWIGFKNNSNDTKPGVAGTDFAGLAMNTSFALQNSDIVPSTGGTTTTGTTYWRAYNTGDSNGLSFQILDGATVRLHTAFSGGLNLPQTPLAAGGYSVLVSMRMTRATGTSTSITINTQTSMLNLAYSSTPTIAAIRALLLSTTYTQSSAFAVTIVPDAIFVYWPFNNSRLRIHSIALEQFAP